MKRTFAHRIAGDIISQSFSNSTKTYHLSYLARFSAGVTRIYVGNGTIYGQMGYVVETSPIQAKVQLIENMYLDIDSSQFFDNMKI